ncbi:fructose-1,6-bisphosphatase class 1/Sedoheputulose-1,7-bisphosphatase [Entophlyctis helioformis]|nr:fructose-1,6-bisphosphatase class 1/Sedoheputulose-1,7-bisphosphatase [Entophlyctis helioformis]
MGDTENLDTDIVPLTRHILAMQQHHKEATGDLTILLASISTACKWISNVVRKAELLKVIGVSGTTNVQQESQQKLDILSNEIMINMLKSTGKTALLVSEENDEAITFEGAQGNYCVVFDPLDGSSNIDCGVSVGTIFGIYRVKDATKKATVADVLRPGSEMVAAGYCMYGSCTLIALAIGGELNGYTLDPNIGEFVLTHRKMKLGKKKIYSLNEGYAHTFHPAIKGYLDTLKFPPPGFTGKFTPYSARYVGSMVADMHRTLLYGGIFLYPGAKLRMLYECFPMAMLVEAAGGKATDGKTRILDIVPTKIHDRSPIYLGTASEVDAIGEWFAKTAGQ